MSSILLPTLCLPTPKVDGVQMDFCTLIKVLEIRAHLSSVITMSPPPNPQAQVAASKGFNQLLLARPQQCPAHKQYFWDPTISLTCKQANGKKKRKISHRLLQDYFQDFLWAQ